MTTLVVILCVTCATVGTIGAVILARSFTREINAAHEGDWVELDQP